MDQIQNYKCPACGAPLVFDGAAGGLHCSSCGNSYSTETMQQIDEAINGAQKESTYDWGSYKPRTFDMAESAGLASYSCPSCGVELICDETTAATSCPYCGNPTVIAGPTPSRTTAVPAGRVPTATVLAAARAENSGRGIAKGCRNAAAFLVVITPQTAWQRA